MRRTRVSMAVAMALNTWKPTQLGPVSPWLSPYNRELHKQMLFGYRYLRAQSVGKTQFINVREYP